jgi:hypothetical protein
MAEIEKITSNRYRIRAHDHILTLDAQDLRDIEAYATLHMAELESEAQQAEPPSHDDIHTVEAYRREYEAQQADELADGPLIDWRAIEKQAEQDLAAIQTDQDAYRFIEKYLSKELRGQLVKIYQSDRHEMNRSPRAAIKNLLSLPPL